MALLIYKQWHRNANLTGTPNSNAKHIKYIGERIHALKKNNPENGLFGKFGGKPFTDNISTKAAEKYVASISRDGKTVFRSCISFTPQRAVMLGLEKNIDRWEEFAKYHIYSIAKNNGIGMKDIEYLAAVHDKEGQPHIHIVFWNKNQQVGVNYVNPKVCGNIRDDLETNVFGELAEEINIEEETESLVGNPSYTVDNGDSVRKALISLTFGNEKKAQFEIQNKMLKYFISGAENAVNEIKGFPELIATFDEIADSVPKKGRLSYGYMPQEVKKLIDNLSDKLMITFPELKGIFEDYLTSKKQVTQMYNSTETAYGRLQTAITVGKAKDKLYAKMGNKILKAISSYKLELKAKTDAERRAEYERSQSAMKSLHVVDLTMSISRLLCREFSGTQGESASAGGTGKFAFGTGDLSKQARLELVYENKDKGKGEER